jgi:ASC-1-like (ASCH) protein
VHLAVLREPYLSYILEGRKTVESRFSRNAIVPYLTVKPGDLIVLKATAGPAVGCFTASWTQFSELDQTVLGRIRADYETAICADEMFWTARAEKRYVTLIGVSDVRRLEAVQVPKSDRRGWIVLKPADQRADAQLSLL